MADSLSDFERTDFSYEGTQKSVYRRGNGPAVIVIHEVPGITPEVANFGRRVSDAGFTTFMPMLFGDPGRDFSNSYAVQGILRACISREFSVLTARQSSPITNFVRALCREAHRECGGPGVGALGMCLTGGFALSLMVEPSVMAPVLSQPSLPFPIGSQRRAALGISERELEAVKERAKEGCRVMGLRFTGDPLVPGERFETLRRELGANFEGIEIDSSRGNPHGISRTAHSVLTLDLVDEEGHPTRAALDRVLGYFNERLRPETA